MHALFHWITDVPAGVVANLAALVLGAAFLRVYVLVSSRRLWSLNDEDKVVVYAAESARTVVIKPAPESSSSSKGAPACVR